MEVSLTSTLDWGPRLKPNPGRFNSGKTTSTLLQEDVWAWGPVWTDMENFALDRPVHSEPLTVNVIPVTNVRQTCHKHELFIIFQIIQVIITSTITHSSIVSSTILHQYLLIFFLLILRDPSFPISRTLMKSARISTMFLKVSEK
jgi:hypothetical protein